MFSDMQIKELTEAANHRGVTVSELVESKTREFLNQVSGRKELKKSVILTFRPLKSTHYIGVR